MPVRSSTAMEMKASPQRIVVMSLPKRLGSTAPKLPFAVTFEEQTGTA